MKARQMQAQFEAQNKRNIKHHSARRGMLTGLAAAAAILIGSTVTVGAVNDWNYAAVFSKFFSDKSGESVIYDFTGMGLDIGQVIEGEGFTMTIQSVLADAGAVYVAYDIELDDEINRQIANYDRVEVNGTLMSRIIRENADGTHEEISPGGRYISGQQASDNVWRCMIIEEMPAGTELDDKQIRLSLSDRAWAVSVTCHAPESDSEPEPIHLYAQAAEYRYDLADITVQSGLSVPYGGTLPNDTSQTVFETMTLTPFVMRFEHEETVDSYDPAAQEMGWHILTPVTYTAVYADGTEKDLKFISSGGMTIYDEDETMLRTTETRYFSTPLNLEGLTAIRLNDTEISVQ